MFLDNETYYFYYHYRYLVALFDPNHSLIDYFILLTFNLKHFVVFEGILIFLYNRVRTVNYYIYNFIIVK